MKQLKLFQSDKEAEKEKPKERKIDTHLGPKSRAMGYHEYLESKDWRNKRRYAIYKAGHRCQRCGKAEKTFHVHHKHYDTLYDERLEDVEVLCTSCHEFADEEREYETGYETWAYKKFGDDWERLDGVYLQDKYDEWLERKQRENDYW